MASHRFTYTGKVRGQGRPRFSAFNGRSRAYKAKADSDYERSIREAYEASGGPHFGSLPLSVRIVSLRSLPKSTPKKVVRMVDDLKPDADNIAKSVLDALSGVAFDDDSQVVSLSVTKADRERREEMLDVEIEVVE